MGTYGEYYFAVETERYFDGLEDMGDKLKDRVEYLEGLVDGDARMITAKLVEIQKLQAKLDALDPDKKEFTDLVGGVIELVEAERKLEEIRQLAEKYKNAWEVGLLADEILEVLDS